MWRQVIIVILFALSAILHTNAQGIDTSFCDPNKLPAAPVQIAFNLFSYINRYQMTIEGNNGQNNETNELTEYYDGVRNVAVTRILTSSSRYDIYAYENTDEVFVIIDGIKCVVDTANDPSNPLPVGPNSQILSPLLSVFSLDPSTKVVYIGKSVVRGINVNQWQACVYDKKTSATSKLTYSLSDPTLWTPAVLANNVSSIPVEVISENKLDNQLWKDTYSIVKFRAELLVDEDFWTTPSGVYCPGRKAGKSAPVMPLTFKLNGIVIDENNGSFQSNYIREIFNYNEKLIRRDYPSDNNVFMSQIEDYNSGVEYRIDLTHGSCDFGELEGDELDAGSEGNIIYMKNTSVLFDFTQFEVQYVGQKTIRNVKSDVWVGGSTTGSINIVYEWYFEVSAKPVEHQKPVALFMYTYDDQNVDFTTYYYFDSFDFSGLDITEFDLTMCSHLLSSRRFMFTIIPSERDVMVNNQRYLRYGIIFAISKASKVSPVRIAHLEIVFEKDIIFVAFSLVEKSSMHGPVVNTEEVSLANALSSLEKAISTNTFLIPLVLSPVSFVNLEIDPDSFQELKKSSRSTPSKNSEGYKGGTVAAIAIIVCVVGIIMGLLVGVFKDFILNKLNLARAPTSIKNPAFSRDEL